MTTDNRADVLALAEELRTLAEKGGPKKWAQDDLEAALLAHVYRHPSDSPFDGYTLPIAQFLTFCCNNAERIARALSRPVPEGFVLVPKEPTKEQWGELARDIVMWMDCYPGSQMTPRNLFRHLERVGTPIPQWLRDEYELTILDHVPSKGTRAAIIYRAMLEPAAPAEREDR